jgi:MtrB/PioB family decaheme-associated outer membrane protein
MKTSKLRSTGTAVATIGSLTLSFAGAVAAEDEPPRELTEPESTVSLGVGYLNHDNTRFGEYNGVTDDGGYALIDVDFLSRDDATGTWFSVNGRNLGLDSREVLIEYERQGKWGVFLEYSQIPRLFPLSVNTGLTGIGDSTQTINGTALRDVSLATERDRYTIGFDVGLPGDLSLAVQFRDETKDGTRLFGRGTGQFLAEPIDSRTRQMEAVLNYTGKRLQLAGGYYGTDFTNEPLFLDINTGADISLPPDNQSHQLYLSGGYSFAPATRATFKMSYARATQDENFFIAPDFPGNTRTNLDGRIDTKAAQLGFTTRPLPALSLLANFRYEDRDDKTPRFQFLTATTGRDGFNTPFSRTLTAGKVEATYRAPWDISLTGGVDYEERERSVLAIRQVSWREENDELTYRVEARRSLSETINGAISFAYSDRGGSDYLPANNNAAADYIDPVHFADRKRDKVRLMLDWTPLEPLSLQFMADSARDRYAGRPLGPERGSARLYSLDAAYTLSETWQINAWLSRDETRVRQLTNTGASGVVIVAQTWIADLFNRGDAAGIGLRGRPIDKLEIGADVQYQRDETEYGLLTAVPTAAAALPDISTKVSSIELFGRYAIRDNFGVRLDMAYNRFQTNDWTWLNWAYADGSTAFLDPRESAAFVGLSVHYSIW